MRKSLKVAGLVLAAAALAAECALIPSEASALTAGSTAAASDSYVAQGTRINICVSITDESHLYVEENSNTLGNCASGYEQFSVISDPAGYQIPSSATVADTVTVTTPATQACTEGGDFALQLDASSSQGLPITSWSLSGMLTDGLKISSGGDITGTCEDSGTYAMTATATDSEGTIGSATFDIEVSA